MVKHLYIPDTQVKPGVKLDHLEWVGKYIVYKRPDVIVFAGDFADMESLSSYDRGKKSFEGRRYKKDVEVTHKALDLLLSPMKKVKGYNPRLVITLGNHEDRINRAINDNPQLDGVISIDDLGYEKWGIEVVPYQEVIEIDGIWYSHFFYNPMSGHPYSGAAQNVLAKVGNSFFMGHQQTLSVATKTLATGKMMWGIIAGAFYQHNEHYKGAQGNHHWRGIIMAHDVNDGNFDPMFVSLDYLRKRYGKKKKGKK